VRFHPAAGDEPTPAGASLIRRSHRRCPISLATPYNLTHITVFFVLFSMDGRLQVVLLSMALLGAGLAQTPPPDGDDAGVATPTPLASPAAIVIAPIPVPIVR